MSVVNLDEIKAFVLEANTKLDKFKQAYSLLAEIPEISRAAFGYPNNFQEHIAKLTQDAQYRLWSDKFHSVATNPSVLHVLSVEAQKYFHSDFTVENVQEFFALVGNQGSFNLIASTILKEYEFDQFKGSMIFPKSKSLTNYNRSGLISDLVFIALVLNGEEVDYVDIRAQVYNLNEMKNYLTFGELDIEVTFAKNGNITVKIPKPLIAKLNAAV